LGYLYPERVKGLVAQKRRKKVNGGSNEGRKRKRQFIVDATGGFHEAPSTRSTAGVEKTMTEGVMEREWGADVRRSAPRRSVKKTAIMEWGVENPTKRKGGSTHPVNNENALLWKKSYRGGKALRKWKMNGTEVQLAKNWRKTIQEGGLGRCPRHGRRDCD